MADTNKIIVQRANVVLQIAPEQLDYYMNQGYNVIDASGNVIKAAIPRDVGTLQKAFIEHTNRIKELEQELDAIKSKSGRKKKEEI